MVLASPSSSPYTVMHVDLAVVMLSRPAQATLHDMAAALVLREHDSSLTR